MKKASENQAAQNARECAGALRSSADKGQRARAQGRAQGTRGNGQGAWSVEQKKQETSNGRRMTLVAQAFYAIKSLLSEIECDCIDIRDTERLEETAYMESCDALEIAQRKSKLIDMNCRAARAWIEKAKVLMFGTRRETEKDPFGEF